MVGRTNQDTIIQYAKLALEQLFQTQQVFIKHIKRQITIIYIRNPRIITNLQEITKTIQQLCRGEKAYVFLYPCENRNCKYHQDINILITNPQTGSRKGFSPTKATRSRTGTGGSSTNKP